MNENISQYLLKYVTNPDPRYAVMLKGKWGCGKSYFIQKWIKEYKDEIKKGNVVIDPIYVSLYGLKETSQITEAIDRALHPFLYSKGAELVKGVFKLAGKVIFKTSLDLDNNGKEDLSMDATLDSLSLLTSRNNNEVVTKIIVFDDLERCLIDMKLILGYINSFVEHGACHVIIVGDETHIDEDKKQQLFEFKEKTIGREFEIKPDVVGAINCFLTDDVPLAEWLTKQKDYILDCFEATQCNNLRLLRQCLYDFNNLYNELDVNLVKKGTSYIKSLLGAYIATYCEYRGENRDIIKAWDWAYMIGITHADNNKTKEQIKSMQSKYHCIGDKYQIDVLNADNIQHIVNEMETGLSNKGYVENQLKQLSGDTSIQEKIADFTKLSNDDFEVAYIKLEQDVKANNIPNIYMMGRSLALMIYFDCKLIHTLDSEVIIIAKEYIENYFVAINNKEELYKAKLAFVRGLESYVRVENNDIAKDICSYAISIFEKRNIELKDKMEEALLSLSDENVASLFKLSMETTPDQHGTYKLSPIFKNIDATIFANKILSLSNSSLQPLCEFFAMHYEFPYILNSGNNCFADDLPKIQQIRDILEREIQNRCSVNKYNLNHLLKYVDGAIRRAEGENNPIDIS